MVTGASADRASWFALLHTGAPIAQAAVIAAVGMLALTRSSFAPTVRFGWLMATLLMTAVLGDLILLPALLAWRAKRGRGSTQRTVPFEVQKSESRREAA